MLISVCPRGWIVTGTGTPSPSSKAAAVPCPSCACCGRSGFRTTRAYTHPYDDTPNIRLLVFSPSHSLSDLAYGLILAARLQIGGGPVGEEKKCSSCEKHS